MVVSVQARVGRIVDQQEKQSHDSVRQAPINRRWPSGDMPRTIRWRRKVVLSLNLVTIALLFGAMTLLMSHQGFVAAEWVMLTAYAVTLPWLSIGLWNSIIGFYLDQKYGAEAAAYVNPALARVTGTEPITTRIAVVMALRNEDPVASIARFENLQRALDRTPWAARFDYHVLSDSDQPSIALQEEGAIAKWRRTAQGVEISYRRRLDNSGYKAGNIAEFVHRCGDAYDFFIPLDADSTMGAETILRLVRVMQVAPEIGLLQSLVTGMPSKTFFTRAFQFGMRHGMRSFTLGSAWWQADCGPNWGHNGIIRMAPFRADCMMPVLSGHGPLSGDILSHDQLEAAFMRRAGYEVRVLSEESESHEENPPSLADFIRRELRWCNGNMQYLRLFGLRGLMPTSRIQLYLAVQMYIAAPAWMLFILTGAGLAAQTNQMAGMPVWGGLTLFAVLMTLSLMPKLMGIAQILADPARATAYGGRKQVVMGGVLEILFSMVTSPIVAFALTLFLLGLIFGKRVGWDAQQRSRDRLMWREAAVVLWPQTVAGISLTIWLTSLAPWALLFGAPMLLALSLSIPIAVFTTAPVASQWSIRRGLFDIPEDRSDRLPKTPQKLHVDVA